MHRLARLFLALALGLAATSVPAATLTVSPALVTNDYSGPVTLTIAGLPAAGLTLRLEKFYDLTTNGVVDATDPLLQSYLLRDGGQAIIAGATNLNVPRDADTTANSQLTVPLSFPGLDPVFGPLEGPYIFRVSSPANAFAPVQQSFTVRQKTYAQFISGVIYSGTLANGLSNAFAVAFDASFVPVTAAKANRAGRYTLYVPPGDYTIWALLPGYVASQSGWAGTLAAASISTAHIALTPGPNTLAGSVRENTSATALLGVPVWGYNSNNLVTVAFTDTNGAFTLKVSPANWEVAPAPEALAALGCVGNAVPWRTNLTADLAGCELTAAPATALLHGILRDDAAPANPLAGVTLNAANAAGTGETVGLSFAADGHYSVGVTAGNWWLQPARESLLAVGDVSAGTNWVLLPGNATRLDLTTKRVTAHLLGRLVEEFLTPVSYATVRATDASGKWVVTAQTDLDGNFDLGVFGGTWRINVDAATAATWWLAGYDLVRSVNDGQTLAGLLYRVRYANASGNGLVRDALGRPLGGIGVRGTATLNGTNFSCHAVTDATGAYWTPALAGNWTFTADCFGATSLSFHGCECAPSGSSVLAANDVNVLPTLTAPLLAPPAITLSALAQGTNFTFTVAGPTNRTFQVIGSTNLAQWTSLFATNPVGGAFRYTATNIPAAPARSYRVLVQ